MFLPLACAFVGSAVYLNTLSADFAYDDSRAIQKNQDLLPETPWQNIFMDDFWGTPLTHSGSHKSYRPLCVLSFRLNYLQGELNPFWFHLTNVIMHGVVVALFTSLSQFLLKSKKQGFLCGLMFATHPIHTEAVAGIVGRAEIGAAMFFLLSFLTYIKYCQSRDAAWLQVHDPISRRHFTATAWRNLVLSLVCAACSMLWKEQGITVLAVNVVYDILVWNKIPPLNIFQVFYKVKHRSLFLGLLCSALWGIVVLTTRVSIMGSSPPEFAPADNPASNHSSVLTRSLTFNFLPAFNLWLLLNPYLLSFDWSMEAIPLIENVQDFRNLATVLMFISLVVFTWYCLRQMHRNADFQKLTKHSNGSVDLAHYDYRYKTCEQFKSVHVAIVALSILVLPFIPATNIFFYVGFVVAERILYIPSMGYTLLVSLGICVIHNNIKKSHHKYLHVSISVLLVLFSVRTVLRNQDWQTEESLYRSGIKINPPKAWGNLANILKSQGNIEEAETAYRKALEYRSNMADVHYNLGVLLQEIDRFEEAIVCYHNAIRYRPRLAMAHLNLGLTLVAVGRDDDAERVYLHAATLDDTGLKDPKTHNNAVISALYNLGRLKHDQKKYEEAVEAFKESIRRRPDYYPPQSLYNMLGDSLSKLGQYKEAESWFLKSLSVKSDHVPAYLTYAHLLDITGRHTEATDMLNKALDLEPENAGVYQHYGQHFAEIAKFKEAADMYRKAIKLRPDDFEIMFNGANAHRQAGLNADAEMYYWKAVMLSPEEPNAYMNLGAMLHVNGKLLEAELQYTRALKLKPDDQMTKDNLRKVRTMINRSKQKNNSGN